MAGPYPPQHGIGPPPGRGPFSMPAYPGMLPPPVPYPRRSRRRLVVGVLLIAAVVAVLAAVLGYAVRGDGIGTARDTGRIAQVPAKTSIQDYLTALLDRDVETIARNTLCGIYDKVTDHRPDNAIAKMNSDAFRKQFSRAEVTSIDKIVYLSDFQAQALFTMRVTHTADAEQYDSTQGVAQLLATDGHVLVCSYELRSAGSF
ncbi:MAG TPA: hypothetical protein VFQ37_09500 [Mycobacterium sp.]|nr:hypothetical protein [Mycobacterium sp.]